MRVYRLPRTEGIESLTLGEADRPRPGPGQVLVRMRAASLNYRDLMIIKGQYSPSGVPANLIPLSDGAGEVEEVGPGVTAFQAGDRVAGIFHQGWLDGEITNEATGTALGGDIDGVLAEYRTFPESGLVRVPEHLSFEEAATLPCAALTAWNAFFELRPVHPGDIVLTQGTGGVSAFAIQFAAAAGARVIATSSSDEKLARAKKLGASELINYRTQTDWDNAVLELTGGRGVDHIVEVGGPGTLPRSLRAVRRGGCIHVIGLLAGKGEINPLALLPKAAIMRGIFVGSRAMFERMNRAISQLELRPVIDQVFSFDQAPAAYARLASGQHFGKIVIRIA
jgi:NADPH:quinone reductase-like Zn-dependent oxidoreductase